jgi:cell division protein FtsL
MRYVKLSLFNKLLGFLLLCLVCSGAVAVVLIRGQMTDLAYAQMRVLFERLSGNMTWPKSRFLR